MTAAKPDITPSTASPTSQTSQNSPLLAVNLRPKAPSKPSSIMAAATRALNFRLRRNEQHRQAARGAGGFRISTAPAPAEP